MQHDLGMSFDKHHFYFKPGIVRFPMCPMCPRWHSCELLTRVFQSTKLRIEALPFPNLPQICPYLLSFSIAQGCPLAKMSLYQIEPGLMNPLICFILLWSLASKNQGDESLGAVACWLNFLTSLSLFPHGLRGIMIPALHKFIVRKNDVLYL